MKMKPGVMQEAQHMRANVAAASRTTPAAKAANERNLRAAKAANAPAPAATAKAPPKGSLNPIKQRMQQGRMAAGSTRPSMTDMQRAQAVADSYTKQTKNTAAPTKAPPKRSLNPFMQRMEQRRMAAGGMMKGYAKGGMANCGASMKPNGAARGK